MTHNLKPSPGSPFTKVRASSLVLLLMALLLSLSATACIPTTFTATVEIPAAAPGVVSEAFFDGIRLGRPGIYRVTVSATTSMDSRRACVPRVSGVWSQTSSAIWRGSGSWTATTDVFSTESDEFPGSKIWADIRCSGFGEFKSGSYTVSAVWLRPKDGSGVKYSPNALFSERGPLAFSAPTFTATEQTAIPAGSYSLAGTSSVSVYVPANVSVYCWSDYTVGDMYGARRWLATGGSNYGPFPTASTFRLNETAAWGNDFEAYEGDVVVWQSGCDITSPTGTAKVTYVDPIGWTPAT